MNTKKVFTSISVGVIVLLVAFFIVFGSSLKNMKQSVVEAPVVTEQTATKTTTSNTTPSKAAETNTTTSTGYTLVDVATHNSATSCWSAINGSVYDLTGWVNSHPGGKAAILMICGKDGSPLFDAQHGKDRKPATILAKFKIGTLN